SEPCTLFRGIRLKLQIAGEKAGFLVGMALGDHDITAFSGSLFFTSCPLRLLEQRTSDALRLQIMSQHRAANQQHKTQERIHQKLDIDSSHEVFPWLQKT